jgi:DNA-binding response OmpR family regulator
MPAAAPSRLARVALVVEDDTTLREAIAAALRDDDFTVLEAPTLVRARVCLARHEVGVVVLDLTLADGDGEPLIAEIDGMQRAPAVVIVSADGLRARRIAATYAVPHLVKPFDLAVACTSIGVAYDTEMRPRPRAVTGRRPRGSD